MVHRGAVASIFDVTTASVGGVKSGDGLAFGLTKRLEVRHLLPV
eukprot:CAMPEP_0171135686 /NCGR_PEP_ID=MMETSP0766_2-20121228/130214_1 /TAXON_ID=439317 /ORGANISM="Gambierdiscus australes, Strain CAWD 149" /LENGTH=43 /DNA_ID= /DNA_START= /DNA_END= /DNA_ORIENTATION=